MTLHPRRCATVVIAALVGTVTAVVLASPALGHVEVSADNPQAGARNVTVTFTGEAESSRAGIASEQVVLPAGISAQDVRLATGPAGWALTATADGFTVAGPALPVGDDAVFSVTIAQLPTGTTELAFKTLETYSDGKVSRWIEIPEAGKPEPANPAPVLKLLPAAVPTTSAAGPAPATVASAVATAVSPDAVAAPADPGDSNTGLWITVAVVAVAVAAAVLLLPRRRRAGS